MEILTRRDWQNPAYIIICSLGNESGHDCNHDALYRWGKGQDPTRPVQYEDGGANSVATDIACPMMSSIWAWAVMTPGARASIKTSY